MTHESNDDRCHEVESQSGELGQQLVRVAHPCCVGCVGRFLCCVGSPPRQPRHRTRFSELRGSCPAFGRVKTAGRRARSVKTFGFKSERNSRRRGGPRTSRGPTSWISTLVNRGSHVQLAASSLIPSSPRRAPCHRACRKWRWVLPSAPPLVSWYASSSDRPRKPKSGKILAFAPLRGTRGPRHFHSLDRSLPRRSVTLDPRNEEGGEGWVYNR